MGSERIKQMVAKGVCHAPRLGQKKTRAGLPLPKRPGAMGEAGSSGMKYGGRAE